MGCARKFHYWTFCLSTFEIGPKFGYKLIPGMESPEFFADIWLLVKMSSSSAIIWSSSFVL